MVNPKEAYIGIPKLIENRPEGPVVYLHVATYFKVRKDKLEQDRIFRAHGLAPCYDPVRITPEIEEELWEDRNADRDGAFTFPPQTLVLGHTREWIIVPTNISLIMRDRFRTKEAGEVLPLTTNLGAPLIHPGSIGPQTYEIYNESQEALKVYVNNLVCVADIDFLTGHSVIAQNKRGNFSDQEPGKIKVGSLSEDWEIEVIRKALSSEKP